VIGFRKKKKKINSNKHKYYEILSKNVLVKQNLDKFLINKDLNKNKKILSHDESLKLLFEFVNNNKRVPLDKEKYNNYSIGLFYRRIKTKLNSINNELYKKLLVNQIIKINLDEFIKNKNINNNKEILSFEQMHELLLEFIKINNKIPVNKEKFNNINITNWFHRQKCKINSKEDELYKKLSTNPIIKMSLDNYIESKNKEKLTFDDMNNICINFINEFKRLPTSKEKYNEINLGFWFVNQKSKLKSTNDELYIKMSKNQLIKNCFDNFLKNKYENND
jgi:hypothetical protein